jgi:predicted nucleic acid-binding protein
VKLCVPQAESAVLLDQLRGYERTISSELTVVETARAAVRAIGPDGLRRAEDACRRLDLISMSASLLERARSLDPPDLRSFDAIHLASALEPRAAPVMVAYDERLLRAAAQHGLATASPH